MQEDVRHVLRRPNVRGRLCEIQRKNHSWCVRIQWRKSRDLEIEKKIIQTIYFPAE